MKQYKKSSIGLIQLRKAIQLYNSANYISAITLAGAADGIFCSLSKNLRDYNTLDNDKLFWDSFSELINRNKPSIGLIRRINGRVKNELKHHDKAKDYIIEANFKHEAEFLIDSAIRNLWIYLDYAPKDRIISRYVKNNWT